MAISLKHSFTSAVADEGDTSLVRPSNWNAEHTLTLATSRILGRTTAGTGAAEEISVGTGLNLSSGSLSVSSTTPQVNTINTFTVAQVIEATDNSNPALRITQLGTADALRIEDETSPDATPFVITANGHAIAGYGSALTIETVVPQFQSHTATLDEGGFGGVDWGNTATGQVNWFGKSRGGSYGVQTIVQNNDTIGDFRFYGSDGTALIPAARLQVAVDGTPGTNDMPGRISFFTTADGASTVTERFRIGNAGQWGIGGATYGTSGQAFISGGASAAPSWGTLGIAGGGTGQTTATAAANALDGFATFVSSATPIVLTNTSPRNIVVTGSITQTITLPDVTTLALGWSFIFTNQSGAGINLQSSGGNAFTAIIAGGVARIVCVAVTGTGTASWALGFIGSSTRTGTGGLVYASQPSIISPTISTPSITYGNQTLTAGTNAQGQGQIFASSEVVFVTSTPNNPSGVTLQTPQTARRVTVYNLGTNSINVYPTSGHTINALAANAAVQIPVGYALLFVGQSATAWRTDNLGTSGQFLKSGGASTSPAWATISNADISGLGTMSTQNADNVSITGGSITGITDLAVADGGTGASTLTGYVKGSGTAALTASATIPNTDITGLGTMSTQAASSVAITGGSITGITDLAIADGGTGASTAADARTNLGLGTMATQAASNVTITGGSITGITDLAVADGGTGASSFTAYSVVLGGTTSTGPLQNVTGLGTSGQVLTSAGAGAVPTWTTPTSGGGAVDGVFWENNQTITANYTVTSSKNAGTFGPVTINSGVTVTVPSGSTWTIV
jgi:hypothetical protein